MGCLITTICLTATTLFRLIRLGRVSRRVRDSLRDFVGEELPVTVLPYVFDENGECTEAADWGLQAEKTET